jgi:hypothetical protein
MTAILKCLVDSVIIFTAYDLLGYACFHFAGKAHRAEKSEPAAPLSSPFRRFRSAEGRSQDRPRPLIGAEVKTRHADSRGGKDCPQTLPTGFKFQIVSFATPGEGGRRAD